MTDRLDPNRDEQPENSQATRIPFTILELIDRVGGLDDIGIQPLNSSVAGIQVVGGKTPEGFPFIGAESYSLVMFTTNQLTPEDFRGAPRKVGIILWFDGDDYRRVFRELRTARLSGTSVAETKTEIPPNHRTGD